MIFSKAETVSRILEAISKLEKEGVDFGPGVWEIEALEQSKSVELRYSLPQNLFEKLSCSPRDIVDFAYCGAEIVYNSGLGLPIRTRNVESGYNITTYTWKVN